MDSKGLSHPDKSLFDNLVKQSPWLTAQKAAAYLRFNNVQQLYDAVFRGQIKVSRIGRRLRLHKEQLDRWLLSQS